MSKIKANIGYPPANGKQMSFRAPCNSADTDGLVVNDVEYTLVDADGYNIAKTPNLWNNGSMVSVILDTINHRAYVQNVNTNGYLEGAFDSIKEQVTQISAVLADKESLTPEFVQSIDGCVDTSKLYVLPDGYIYAYASSVWQSTGIKIAEEIPSQIVTSVNGQTGNVVVQPPMYIVTITGGNLCDQKYSDIMAAYQAGCIVQCRYDTFLLPLQTAGGDECVFTTVVGSMSYNVVVHSNRAATFTRVYLSTKNDVPKKISELENDSGFLTEAPVTSVNGQGGDVKTFVKVTVTRREDDTYTADLSCASILEAHNNKCTVYCQWGSRLLSLLSVSDDSCAFGCVYSGNVYTVEVGASFVTVSTTSLSAGGSGGGVVVDGDKVVLTDRKTAKKYVLYVSDGKLMMEESEE